MKNMRLSALALLGVVAVAAVAPANAQDTKADKKAAKRERKAERKMEKREAKMATTPDSGTMAAPSAMNNTADVQRNIDNANKTLNDMVALLDQIEARKKGGAQ